MTKSVCQDIYQLKHLRNKANILSDFSVQYGNEEFNRVMALTYRSLLLNADKEQLNNLIIHTIDKVKEDINKSPSNHELEELSLELSCLIKGLEHTKVIQKHLYRESQ